MAGPHLQLTTARLLVTHGMVDLIVLPPGFTERWSRTVRFGVQELLIEGPFDAAIPDGACVEVSIRASPLEWQWIFDCKPVGVPLPIVLL